MKNEAEKTMGVTMGILHRIHSDTTFESDTWDMVQHFESLNNTLHDSARFVADTKIPLMMQGNVTVTK